MSQVAFSPAAWAVNNAETTFKSSENDGYPTMGAKAVTRAVVDTVLTVAALAETIVFATLTILASPGGLFEMTSAPFNFAKEHTAEAGKATLNAAKGIVGLNSKEITKATITPTKVPPSTFIWNGIKSGFSAAGDKAWELKASLQNKVSKTSYKTIATYTALAAITGLGVWYRSEIIGAVSAKFRIPMNTTAATQDVQPLTPPNAPVTGRQVDTEVSNWPLNTSDASPTVLKNNALVGILLGMLNRQPLNNNPALESPINKAFSDSQLYTRWNEATSKVFNATSAENVAKTLKNTTRVITSEANMFTGHIMNVVGNAINLLQG